MWRTDTYWFDVAIATSGLMLGHLYFGGFEENKPRWRLLLKSLLGLAIVVATTAFAGRVWTYVLLGAIAIVGTAAKRFAEFLACQRKFGREAQLLMLLEASSQWTTVLRKYDSFAM